MYMKIAMAGATVAAIVGVGTAAVAVTGSTGGLPTPTASSSPAAGAGGTAAVGGTAATGGTTKAGRHPGLAKLAARSVHAQLVTRSKDGTFVTHDEIRGEVTAVSGASVTVKAADGTGESFSVTSATVVRIRAAGKGVAGSISQVKVGDTVIVVGTGSGTLTATAIVDVQK